MSSVKLLIAYILQGTKSWGLGTRLYIALIVSFPGPRATYSCTASDKKLGVGLGTRLATCRSSTSLQSVMVAHVYWTEKLHCSSVSSQSIPMTCFSLCVHIMCLFLLFVCCCCPWQLLFLQRCKTIISWLPLL